MITSEKGYKIFLDTVRKILNVRAWGVWDAEDKKLAENFKRELQEKVKEVGEDGKEWSVWEDFVKLRPRSKEVCRIMGDGLIFAIRYGMKKVVRL